MPTPAPWRLRGGAATARTLIPLGHRRERGVATRGTVDATAAARPSSPPKR